jgi:hypothetical protein
VLLLSEGNGVGRGLEEEGWEKEGWEKEGWEKEGWEKVGRGWRGLKSKGGGWIVGGDSRWLLGSDLWVEMWE